MDKLELIFIILEAVFIVVELILCLYQIISNNKQIKIVMKKLDKINAENRVLEKMMKGK